MKTFIFSDRKLDIEPPSFWNTECIYFKFARLKSGVTAYQSGKTA